jgi:membrane protease YdiL (CAAX protease family)
MFNLIWMTICIALGAGILFLARRKATWIQMAITIGAFSLARSFFGLAWRFLNPGLSVVWSPGFIWLLVVNFIIVSLIYLALINRILKVNLIRLGWGRNNIAKDLLIGMIAGAIILMAIVSTKQINLSNTGLALFFGFFIASWQEENIFRGYLINYLREHLSAEETLVCQALIFSLAHLGFYSFQDLTALLYSLLFAFLLGLVFGALRLGTGRLLPGFICHGLVDLAILW